MSRICTASTYAARPPQRASHLPGGDWNPESGMRLRISEGAFRFLNLDAGPGARRAALESAAEIARVVDAQHALLRRELVLLHEADGAGHAVRPVVAVAAGVLVEVLLVVVLGVVEEAGVLG